MAGRRQRQGGGGCTNERTALSFKGLRTEADWLTDSGHEDDWTTAMTAGRSQIRCVQFCFEMYKVLCIINIFYCVTHVTAHFVSFVNTSFLRRAEFDSMGKQKGPLL